MAGLGGKCRLAEIKENSVCVCGQYWGSEYARNSRVCVCVLLLLLPMESAEETSEATSRQHSWLQSPQLKTAHTHNCELLLLYGLLLFVLLFHLYHFTM